MSEEVSDPHPKSGEGSLEERIQTENNKSNDDKREDTLFLPTGRHAIGITRHLQPPTANIGSHYFSSTFTTLN